MSPIQAEMLSDVGRLRQRNEDIVEQSLPSPDEPAAKLGQLFVLADGVGGTGGGDIASQRAVREVIRAYYDEDLSPVLDDVPEDMAKRLQNAVKAANRVVYGLRQEDAIPQPLATTLVLAAVRENHFAIASVGDSPAFLVRAGTIRKLTVDHNFAEMQYRSGHLTRREAFLHPDRNKLVRAVGSDGQIEVDVIADTLIPGDYLLLGSDGLTRYVGEQELVHILNTRSLSAAVKEMVNRANEYGGFDNISVIVLQALNADGSVPVAAIRGQVVIAGGKRRSWIRRVLKGSVRRLRHGGALIGATLAFWVAIRKRRHAEYKNTE